MNSITAVEAVHLLQRGAILLDVRSRSAHRCRAIPHSIAIPFESLDGLIYQLPQDFDRPVIVYCTNGSKSEAAGRRLEMYGYHDVYDLGGIAHWNHLAR